MRNVLVIILSGFIVIINGLIGHFFAPKGIEFTPVVLITTSCLMVFGTKNIPVVMKSLGVFFLVIFNDILIKLYAGGTHDSEGLAWIQVYMLFGLVPSFICLLIAIFHDKNEKEMEKKIAAAVLFPVAMILYHFAFWDLGLHH